MDITSNMKGVNSENRDSSLLSNDFAKMSFISAVMIVYLHTGGAANNEVLLGWVNKAIFALCRIAIPWFFFASGFFLAKHIGEDGWWRSAIKKRIRTLIIPFWIWGTIIFLFYCSIGVAVHIFNYQYNGINTLEWLSVKGLMRVVGLDYTGNMPTMWYLRSLFILVVLSPLVYRGKLTVVAAFFFMYIAFSLYSVRLSQTAQYVLEYLLSLRGLLYFSLGMYLYSHGKRFADWWTIVIGVMGFVFLACNLYNGSRISDVLMVPGLMVVVYSLVRHMKIPTILTASSFTVYVTHIMIAYSISAFYGVMGIGGEGNVVFALGLLRFAVTFCSAVILTSFIKKIFPAFARIAFGGR